MKTIIAAYAQNVFVKMALQTTKQMQSAGIEPIPQTLSLSSLHEIRVLV
jgi:hypothetical protein